MCSPTFNTGFSPNTNHTILISPSTSALLNSSESFPVWHGHGKGAKGICSPYGCTSTSMTIYVFPHLNNSNLTFWWIRVEKKNRLFVDVDIMSISHNRTGLPTRWNGFWGVRSQYAWGRQLNLPWPPPPPRPKVLPLAGLLRWMQCKFVSHLWLSKSTIEAKLQECKLMQQLIFSKEPTTKISGHKISQNDKPKTSNK